MKTTSMGVAIMIRSTSRPTSSLLRNRPSIGQAAGRLVIHAPIFVLWAMHPSPFIDRWTSTPPPHRRRLVACAPNESSRSSAIGVRHERTTTTTSTSIASPPLSSLTRSRPSNLGHLSAGRRPPADSRFVGHIPSIDLHPSPPRRRHVVVSRAE